MVAVIWPDNTSSSESLGPHILVSGKSADSHRIQHYYSCYCPLQYPLLFPRGEWNQGLKKMSHGGHRQADTKVDPVQSCAVHNVENLLAQEATRKPFFNFF